MRAPEALAEQLRNGVFISSMMSWTTGAYLARHGEGCAMVQLGALIADRIDRSHQAQFLLPLEEDDMAAPLQREVEAVRAALPDVVIALNAAPGDLESCMDMARAFHRAGGDVFELNCHGGYGPLLDRGLLRAMTLPENVPVMLEWLRALATLEIPSVVKFPMVADADFARILTLLREIDGLFGVHFNIGRSGAAGPDLAFGRWAREEITGQLWVSGLVRTGEQTRALHKAGIDCVGVAQGLLDDEGIIEKLGGKGAV
ncbi:MAG: hypothetical protein KAI66_05130 [Lentisphaeria bacterium]|nr:hypothetical protein [Lentisphaeria bacterium]